MRIPPTLGSQVITLVLGTSRYQLPDMPCSSVTLQAPDTNTGAVYVGGATVTNAIGAAEGIKLSAGNSLNNIAVDNLNMLYVAADTTLDVIRFLVT